MFSTLGKIIKWIGEHFKGMLFLLIVLVIFMPKSNTPLSTANLQEIKLTGPIICHQRVTKTQTSHSLCLWHYGKWKLLCFYLCK